MDRWAGRIEVSTVARPFRADSAWTRFERVAFAEWSARYNATGAREAPATFFLDDGVLRVEQTTTLSDGRTLRITGERISTQAAEGC